MSGLGRTVLLLAVIWWMYGGYAWLTNALDLGRAGPRLLLLTGMAAYFVMSLAVPRFFDDGPFGLILGLAYLVVVLVHTAGFLGTSGRAGDLPARTAQHPQRAARGGRRRSCRRTRGRGCCSARSC